MRGRARRKTAWRENQALGGLVKTFQGAHGSRCRYTFSIPWPLLLSQIANWVVSTVQKIEIENGSSKKDEQYENIEKRKRRKMKSKNRDERVKK